VQNIDFAYLGESKRSWSSRGAEHKPGTRSNNENAIRFHAESTARDIHPDNVEILGRKVVRGAPVTPVKWGGISLAWGGIN